MHRLRTFILITGTLLSLMIAAAFVVSAWWYLWIGVDGAPFVSVYAGAFEYSFPASVTGADAVLHTEGLRHALVGIRPIWPSGFILPLIYPFTAVVLSTLLAWRFWPKPPKPGHCRCGYDLTGNTSGVCPECGVEVQT